MNGPQKEGNLGDYIEFQIKIILSQLTDTGSKNGISMWGKCDHKPNGFGLIPLSRQ
ncbi:hypothetical protein GCM10011516_19850 [Sphingobacterium cellulitidis]|uniref:Uncharacterized protein n=1 Tax=Sphingobacterium cellulitidis TaxID=1768011 RepID=A0A8H9KXU2_9SPHI|nr:hypothetical protein GCM10011516_19850 [Sphingobacterium soli]